MSKQYKDDKGVIKDNHIPDDYNNENNRVKVYAPDGEVGTIPLQELSAAFDDGFTLYEKKDRYRMLAPDGEEGTVPSNSLEGALKDGFTLKLPGATDRAKQFGQGLAEGVGGVVDTANKYVGAPITAGASYLTKGVGKAVGAVEGAIRSDGTSPIGDKIGEYAQDQVELSNQYHNSNKAKEWSENENLQPDSIIEDTTKKVLHGAGAITGEAAEWVAGTKALGAANKAINGAKIVTAKGAEVAAPWLDKINKLLFTDQAALKTTGEFMAGAAASESIKDRTDSAATAVVKDLGGFMFGGLALNMAIPTTIKAGKSIGNTVQKTYDFAKNPSMKEFAKAFPDFIKHPIDNLVKKPLNAAINKPYEWAIRAGNTKLDEKAIEVMREMGVELNTTSIYEKNNAPIIIANLLPNQIFKDTIKNVDEKVIKFIENQLDANLGKVPYEGDIADRVRSYSNRITEDISNLTDIFKDLKNTAYEKADMKLVDTDYGNPESIIHVAKEIISKTEAPATSGTSQGSLHEIANKIIRSWAEEKVHPRELANQKRALNEYMQKGDIIGDSKTLAVKLNNQIDNVIELATEAGTISDKSYIKSLNEANVFYKEQYAPLLTLDVSKTLLTGDKPDYLFKLASTHEGLIKALETLKTMDASSEYITKSVSEKLHYKIEDPFRRLIAQNYIIQKTKNIDGSIDYKKLQKLFIDTDDSSYLNDALSKEKYNGLYKNLKKNIIPLANKMIDIEKRLTEKPMNEVKELIKIASFAGGSVVGGGITTAGGVLTGTAAVGVKSLLGLAWARAATDTNLIDRLIMLSKKESDKETINFLMRIIKNSSVPEGFKGHTTIKGIKETKDKIDENMPSKETMKKSLLRGSKALHDYGVDGMKHLAD